MPHVNYVTRVIRLFRAHRGQWIDGMRVARVGGIYAWRTTISRARKQAGLTIENRVRFVGKRKVSEYRLTRKAA